MDKRTLVGKNLEFDPMLIKCMRVVPGGKVLDLGIGQGRNASLFASMGYSVDGIDVSEAAINACNAYASENDLSIRVWAEDVRTMDIPKDEYSIIVAAYVLQYFPRRQVLEILEKIKASLPKGGIVYIGAFSTRDAGFRNAQENPDYTLVDTNTFFSQKRNYYIHCFADGELVSLFSDFALIQESSVTDIDLDHDEPHFHSFIVYIGQKC